MHTTIATVSRATVPCSAIRRHDANRSRLSLASLFLFAVFVTGLPADASSIPYNESADVRHLNQFEAWVLGSVGDRRIFKTTDVIYTVIVDPSVTEIPLPDEFSDIVADISHLTGTPVRLAASPVAGSDPTVRILEVPEVTVASTQENHLDDFIWATRSSQAWGKMSDKVLPFMAGIFAQYGAGTREYYSPCIPLAYKGDDALAGKVPFRVLALMTPNLVTDRHDAGRRRAYCHISTFLHALGFDNHSAIPPSNFFVQHEGRFSLSPDLRCVLAFLYNERISHGMNATAALTAAQEIIRNTEACQDGR